MGLITKLAWVALPALAGCGMLSQVSSQGTGTNPGGKASAMSASKARALVPGYARQIKEFNREVVFEMKTADGKAVGNGVLEFVQPTVLGYVNAKHPAVRNYTTQRVFEQRFFVDGKEINYVDVTDKNGKIDKNKLPPAGTPYWTTLPDIKVGYDVTHIYTKPSNPSASSVKLVGLYKGYTFTPPTWAGLSSDVISDISTKLSPQENALFSASEIGPDKDYSHQEVSAILARHGMLRKIGENTVAYAKRYHTWAKSHFAYDGSNGTEDHIGFMRQGGAGNCNPLAAAYELGLRSQGVKTRIVSGIALDNGTNGHSFTQFYDEENGIWLNFIDVTSSGDRLSFGDYSPDVFVFQPYSRYWYQSTIREDDGIATGNQLGSFYGFTNTNPDGILKVDRMAYNMQNTWIRDVDD